MARAQKKAARKRVEKRGKKRVKKRGQKVAPKLTHLGKSGEARMVDVSAKSATEREAIAEARIAMLPATLDLVSNQEAVQVVNA